MYRRKHGSARSLFSTPNIFSFPRFTSAGSIRNWNTFVYTGWQGQADWRWQSSVMDLYPATLINAAYTRNQCQLQGIRGVHMCIGSFVGSRRLSMEQKTHTTQQKKGWGRARNFCPVDWSVKKTKMGGICIYTQTSFISWLFHLLYLCSLLIPCLFFFNFLGLLTFYFLTLWYNSLCRVLRITAATTLPTRLGLFMCTLVSRHTHK
jgi:hypothetical protein